MRIINIKAKSYRIMAQTMVEAHEAQGFDLPDVGHIGEKKFRPDIVHTKCIYTCIYTVSD